MPRYRVSYRDRDSRLMRAFVTGPSVDWVHEHLRLRGASNVSVHGEDVLSPVGRDLRAELKSPRLPPRSTAWRAARQWTRLIAPLLLVDVVVWTRRPPGTVVLPAVLVLLTLIAIAWAGFAVAPVILNHEVQTALVWHRWKRALLLLRLRAFNPRQQLLPKKPALKHFYAGQRAKALAGLGRLAEALAVLDDATAGGVQSPGGVLVTQSSLYILARRYEEAIPMRRQAARMDPRCAFDAAIAMLRYGGDVEEARALLASRNGTALTQMECGFERYATGLLAMADQRFSDALARFAEARAVLDAELARVPANRFQFAAIIDGYRALALASLGEPDAAARILRPVETFLAATEDALLADCRAVLLGPDVLQGCSGDR